MSNPRITLKDLAKELQLSPSTISRAIAGHPAISESTKKKVQKKAEELGFAPNSIAAGFRKKRTYSIGVIVPQIDVHFHSLVISGIEDLAYREGYNITIFQSKDSIDREKEIAKILQNRLVEGIIVCLSNETKSYTHFKRLVKLGVPIIFYDRVPTDFQANKVVIDDFGSAFKATEHLIEQGCKRIGHIAGNQSTSIFKHRFEGYKAALKAHNIPYNPDLVLETQNLSYEEGAISARKLIALPQIPDGVFCSNDYTAISAVQVFQKAGFKVPEQIAVVGFSNYPISQVIQPNLTTVNDRAFQMGEAAAKLLIRQIENEDNAIDFETITLKTDLVIRESSLRKK
ncbi:MULTISPECIES: LacI family DNA-binding transcriptional regulator [Flavobacteriaceae]|uniref:LacI family DNA-binding transcriptional regulator n=1 Tax=Flavobacteriaceae TaxID=49546 RepID=UPI002349BAC9|nr:LacI family DNA-binding transcriptional regulator [Muricauda sp. SP22]MDC6364038.1 LacI family DNA-binding transcriptional regulator [Muricauda sp. SP22]